MKRVGGGTWSETLLHTVRTVKGIAAFLIRALARQCGEIGFFPIPSLGEAVQGDRRFPDHGPRRGSAGRSVFSRSRALARQCGEIAAFPITGVDVELPRCLAEL
ncbi:hypothetical protein [Paenibacillus hamazuiensis]|uniref:hypothetical protein n=1 Tax=Paenibacillus hamazuiensis TaxID=2936508 RepID=UPI00200DC455|nr:hypothetical protein [Paenibacillus hamazuiensis]